MKPEPRNKFEKPANIYKNIAIIKNAAGNSQEAIAYSYRAIRNFSQYIRSVNRPLDVRNAKMDLCRAVDNLSIYYSQVGDLTRANHLLRYSYESKKANLEANDPEILSTEVLLGSNYNNLGNYDLALQVPGISGVFIQLEGNLLGKVEQVLVTLH